MSGLFEKIGGRKFVFMIILLGVGLAVDLYTARGLSATFKELMVFLAAIYVTGNGISTLSSSVVNGIKAKAKVEVKSSKDMDKTLQDVANSNEVIVNNLQLTNQALNTVLQNIVENK